MQFYVLQDFIFISICPVNDRFQRKAVLSDFVDIETLSTLTSFCVIWWVWWVWFQHGGHNPPLPGWKEHILDGFISNLYRQLTESKFFTEAYILFRDFFFLLIILGWSPVDIVRSSSWFPFSLYWARSWAPLQDLVAASHLLLMVVKLNSSIVKSIEIFFKMQYICLGSV